MMKLITLFSLLCLVSIIKADLPVHCTHDQIMGEWTFFLSKNDLGLSYDCNNWDDVNDVNKKMVFHLKAPNIVECVSDPNVSGNWTMVYDQGFEIQTDDGWQYWAFNKFEVQPNGTSVSYCDSTSKGRGYYHQNEVKPKYNGCYYGEKPSKVDPVIISGRDTRTSPLFDSSALVERINAAQTSWTAKVYDEFQFQPIHSLQQRLGPIRTPERMLHRARAQPSNPSVIASLPITYDWRNISGVDYVGDMRDQLSCGSCYAFATIEVMESRIRIYSQNKKKLLLSPQDPVSCNRYTQGCDGGFAYLVAKYGQEFGVCELRCMAYEWSSDTPCYYKCNDTTLYHYFSDPHYVGGYYGACSESEMMETIYTEGPIAVGVAVPPDFVTYSGGIYHHVAKTNDINEFFEETDHAVILVGWGEDAETHEKYWILKNSWGRHWGETGYMRIRRGTDEVAVESMGFTLNYFPLN